VNQRTYRSALDMVHSGYLACWRNASDLVKASKLLIDANLHAPALSLAILALEELGKLGVNRPGFAGGSTL
jgi:AbiV family abortive infection protein